MAALPFARRALARRALLPWLVTAAALIAISVTVPLVVLLGDTSGAGEPVRAADAASVAGVGPTAGSDGVAPVADGAPGSAPAPSPVVTAVDEATLSAGVIAAEAEAYLSVTLARAEAAAASEPVAEVSEAPARTVAETQPSAVEDAADSPPAPAPVANTRPAAAEDPPPQPVVQPSAQAAPIRPAGPVQGWAAAGIVIETRGQALDDASLANINAALSVLPSSVLSNLGNPAFGPLHILVNTEGRTLSGDRPYGGPANFFSTNEGTNELVLYPRQSVFTIVHELGHAYNLRRIPAGRYAMVLLDPEMRSFLDATGWRIASTDKQIHNAVDHMHVDYTYHGSFHWPRLSNDDPLEDFANSFAMYFLDPASLRQMSPERYAWMAGTFGS